MKEKKAKKKEKVNKTKKTKKKKFSLKYFKPKKSTINRYLNIIACTIFPHSKDIDTNFLEEKNKQQMRNTMVFNIFLIKNN